MTLGAVAARYLDAKRGKIRVSTYRVASRYFAVQWHPLRDRSIGRITKADVAAQLQIIAKAHGRASAARARANLSAVFAWAIGEALCDAIACFPWLRAASVRSCHSNGRGLLPPRAARAQFRAARAREEAETAKTKVELPPHISRLPPGGKVAAELDLTPTKTPNNKKEEHK
jgi:hypothetical protein